MVCFSLGKPVFRLLDSLLRRRFIEERD